MIPIDNLFLFTRKSVHIAATLLYMVTSNDLGFKPSFRTGSRDPTYRPSSIWVKNWDKLVAGSNPGFSPGSGVHSE